MELQAIENKIITIQGKQVILDSDVAELYSVETKRINEAVKNNPDKFPKGYIIILTDDEMRSLRSKISTLENIGRGKHAKYNAKCFSEKGLYMLATILKSPKATETQPSRSLKLLPKSENYPVRSLNYRNNPIKSDKSL